MFAFFGRRSDNAENAGRFARVRAEVRIAANAA